MKKRRLGPLSLYRWLQEPAQGHFVAKCTLLAFALALYSALAAYASVLVLGAEKVQANSALRPDNLLVPWNIFAALVVAPVWEEMVLRALPLGLFLLCRGKDYNSLGKMFQLFLLLVVTSIGFGLLHSQVTGVLIQGVIGFVLGIVFLKWSMPETNIWAGISKGAVAAIAVHSLYNTILLLPAIILIALQT